MVNPLRPPTIVPNISIPNSLTQPQQFQTIFFNAKELLKAAGGTILISSGTVVGVATAGAGDNIPNVAGVTLGAAGAGAWYVVEFASFGGQAIRFLIYVDDATDPRQIVGHRGGGATWTGGTTAALPTVNTGFAYSAEAETLHPFTDLRNLRMSTWRTANNAGAQSIRFLVKEEGAGVETSNVSFWAFEANTDADGGGVGAHRWWLYVSTSMTSTNFRTQSPYTALNTNGLALVQPISGGAIWDLCSSYTGGVDQNNNANIQELLVGMNSATVGRLFGAWIDLFAVSQTSILGIFTKSTEAGQTNRRMNFGDVAMFWPDGVGVS